MTPSSRAAISAPLLVLGEIAARFASAASLDDSVPAALQSLCSLLRADGCSVWLRVAGGLGRRWSTGTDSASAVEIERATRSKSTSGRLTVALQSAGRRVGALTIALPHTISAEERTTLAAVGDLLASAVAHSEVAHELELEVERHTRQAESTRLFTERIIDSLPMGLYVIDREYRICAWNRKRETGMQGVSREEAIGRTIFEILHRQPAELLRREFDEVFMTGRVQQFQMESTATGDVRTFRITKIPMRLEDTLVSHVITIGEDITEWKAAETRFAQAEKLAAIGQLAAGVMHEINNPLATIAACAETLELEKKVDPSAQEYLSIIDKEVHRCKRIINGLLEFSRPASVLREPIDLNAVIEETLFLLKHHSRFKQITVRTEFDRKLPPVLAGREQLIQVFMALLINAMDAQGEIGTVAIRTRHNDLYVFADVKDEGHGIAHPELTKIFEPFYTTKQPGRGTGLGLSIVYGIIADHGGRIEVDSAPGTGSTFRIVLPSAPRE